MKMTTEHFIAKATEMHAARYNYDQVQYTDASTKVEVICPQHGAFMSTPSNHLKGQGCPQCAAEKSETT